MAPIFLTKTRNILNISKSLPLCAFSQTSTPPFSTAFERAKGSNAVAETEGISDGGLKREGMSRSKSNEAARDEPKRAMETADMVKYTAKPTMDGAWMASKESAHKLRDDELKQQPNSDN